MRLLPSIILALTGVLTAIGIALLAATLSVPLAAEDWGFRGFTALFAITFSTVGWVIARRQPGHALGWLLLANGSLAAAGVFCQGYAVYGALAHPGSLPGVVWFAWLYSWIWVPGATTSGVHTLLLFPDGHLPGPRWRVVAWLGALIGVLLAAAIAITPGPLQNFAALQNPLGAGPKVGTVVQIASEGALGVTIGASAFSLVLRFRRSSGIARQQLKWMAYMGVLLAIGVLPSGVFTGGTGLAAKLAQLLVILAFAAIPVAIGVAVLRYRLYDIDLLINRTAVYGSVTVLLAALFAVANIALQRLAESVTGQHSDLVTGGLVVGAALSFGPMRRAVRPVVDRVLPGRVMLTLLFTDIVGSTQKIVELGDVHWQALLARFRSTVRQELARNGGREVTQRATRSSPPSTDPQPGFAARGRFAVGCTSWGLRLALACTSVRARCAAKRSPAWPCTLRPASCRPPAAARS